MCERRPGTGYDSARVAHNRAIGDRIAALLSSEMLKVAVGLVLTAPFTSMLFMAKNRAPIPPEYRPTTEARCQTRCPNAKLNAQSHRV